MQLKDCEFTSVCVLFLPASPLTAALLSRSVTLLSPALPPSPYATHELGVTCHRRALFVGHPRAPSFARTATRGRRVTVCGILCRIRCYFFERRCETRCSLVYAWLIYALKAFGCSFRTIANAVLRARAHLTVACQPRSVSFAFSILALATKQRTRLIHRLMKKKRKKGRKKKRTNASEKNALTSSAFARRLEDPLAVYCFLNATILCFCTKVVASNFALNK